MSVEVTTDEPPGGEPAAEVGESETAADEQQGQQEPAGGNAEAARYRRRLRDAETQRDALSGRVERLQRTEAERVAGQHLAQGSDLFLFAELGELLDDDGEVDETKVREAAKRAAAARPGLGHHRADLGQGARESAGAPAAWSSVIGGR